MTAWPFATSCSTPASLLARQLILFFCLIFRSFSYTAWETRGECCWSCGVLGVGRGQLGAGALISASAAQPIPNGDPLPGGCLHSAGTFTMPAAPRGDFLCPLGRADNSVVSPSLEGLGAGRTKRLLPARGSSPRSSLAGSSPSASALLLRAGLGAPEGSGLLGGVGATTAASGPGVGSLGEKLSWGRPLKFASVLQSAQASPDLPSPLSLPRHSWADALSSIRLPYVKYICPHA